MSKKQPVIEILYPEVANLFGDVGNVECLKLSVPQARFVTTKLTDEPLFVTERPDLIYLGPMSERAQEMVLDCLRPYGTRLAELIADDVIFLVTGNALELFGQKICCEDGREIECLNIFPTWARRTMMKRYNSLVLGEFKEMTIVGFKSQFSHSYGDNDEGFFLAVTKGSGLNPESRQEGLRRRNFIATYLLGPLLPLNPPFVSYLKKLLGCSDTAMAFEKEALEAYQVRVAEMSSPKLKF